MKNMGLIKIKAVVTVLSEGGHAKVNKTEETEGVKYSREFLEDIGATPNKDNCSDFEDEQVVHLKIGDFEEKVISVLFLAEDFKLIEKVDGVYTLYLKGGEAYELIDRHEAKKVEKRINKICKYQN